ncbi:hypothetical protein AVEN_207295-1 [Araneus ventricosus]|uniref:Uncharacterized protein n=1 Tax=Araneus ventricosus TaxID=182803 RepID=A0A4Y2GHM8_ARAVE|nr:hypothetical protein AVEN_231642-1 [Araneus ventricosus]GBM52147.1 hypothetical protein AVEN_44792-1 [Araneus ventricosus]GBM52256.1 hypothetical protein AVEN_239456-1 [Araneus ventricosus]GBM52276.1 hypothetical protein AVEN_207295-1 [Araneus ventricosus]
MVGKRVLQGEAWSDLSDSRGTHDLGDHFGDLATILATWRQIDYSRKCNPFLDISIRGRDPAGPCVHGAWLGKTSRRSTLVLVDCVRWNSDQSRRFGKSLSSARVNGCTDTVCPLFPPLMDQLFTAAMRETTNALTNPRATLILPVAMTRNNANRG